MSLNPPYVTAVVAAVGVAGSAYCAYKFYEATKKRIPENWVEVGKLKDLYVYPIKSCAPVLLKEVESTDLGLKQGWLRDRVLMVVDDKKNFITARVYPDMLSVFPSINGAILTLTHNDAEPVSVNLAEVITTKTTKATVWGTSVDTYDCGEAVGKWFSKLLGVEGLRMMYYASDKCRPLRDATNKYIFKFGNSDTGALPDETSYNLINEASVEDLNTRLPNPVTHQHFRPNFVLQGAKALDEDNWRFIKIGECVFEIIKPCFRCVLTTIDPETGVRDAKTEPLQTLRSYRMPEDPAIRKAAGTSPRMGVQMTLRTPPGGKVRLNDTISVSYA